MAASRFSPSPSWALFLVASLAACDPTTTTDSSATLSSSSGAGLGGGGAAPADPCSPFVGSVVDVQYGEGAGFGQEHMPGVVMGPPLGGGEQHGSLDVVSLGNGGRITVAFGDRTIEDGPGPDFIVFENAFYAGGDPASPFAEIAAVEVSEDGSSWTAFPCTATAAPWGACAGWHPTLANPEDNDLDPLDPAVAGGDAFDLADIGVTRVRFVRITDRVDLVGDTPSFDLDAVALVHSTCSAE
ncbi:MAG: hypothetical protein U0414_08950 [Polyangiaceae bacterium]